MYTNEWKDEYPGKHPGISRRLLSSSKHKELPKGNFFFVIKFYLFQFQLLRLSIKLAYSCRRRRRFRSFHITDSHQCALMRRNLGAEYHHKLKYVKFAEWMMKTIRTEKTQNDGWLYGRNEWSTSLANWENRPVHFPMVVPRLIYNLNLTRSLLCKGNHPARLAN